MKYCNVPWQNRTEVGKMKTTANGFRITKNGNVMLTIEEEAIQATSFQGNLIKQEGEYYFYNRRQGNIFVYLP